MDEHLAALTEYLRQVRITAEYPKDPDGGYIKPDVDGVWYTSESSPAADIAREWTRKLLQAADVYTAYGCPLCQG